MRSFFNRPEPAARIVIAFAALAALAVPRTAQAIAPGVQEGDLFVGAASTTSFGQPAGARGIFRVRDGVVTPFSLGSADPNDPGFFDIPHDVIVDSQGRVVWLAPLGVGSYSNHVGLFRASGEGATPERLAIFRVGDHDLDEGYPNPFPNLQLCRYDNGPPAIGLHLASNRRVEIDDDVKGGLPQIVTEEAYVMGLIYGTGGISNLSGAQTVSYGATTGVWDDSLPPPIYLMRAPAANNSPPVDMISHAGALYSIDDYGLRRSSTPLRVDASGRVDLGPLGGFEFSLGLRLFGGDHEVRGILIDDTKIPNVPSGVPPEYPNPPRHDMPLEWAFIPMSGFRSLVYDPQLGLVISSNYGPIAPYITQISHTLLNDNPDDDLQAYFYHPYLGFTPVPSLGVTRMFPPGQWVDPGTGIWYPTNASVIGAPGGGGLVAIPTGSNSVVRVTENGGVDVLASGLIAPGAVGSYPTYSSPSAGLAIIIRVDSPVDVLLTDPSGLQIGIDPATSLFVNDFGESGFDSGPGEPRFFGIRNPQPGDWSIEALGTDSGPFALNVYGIDLDQPLGTRARWTGTASPGVRHDLQLVLDSAGNVTIIPEPSTLSLAAAGLVTAALCALRLSRNRHLDDGT